jgi:hydrogenase maturation factor
MNMSGMDNMVGMHEMSATVKAIDSKTGLVDVDAGGMALKVHFPPSTLKELKTGDKITLHLGFAKS